MKETDENIQHLGRKDAIRKMKELVGHAKTCMFTTRLAEPPFHARPMATQEVDDEGNFWFFSDELSYKNMEIENDSRVQLFFANHGSSEFMSIYGHAMISRDRKRIDELWHPMAKAWFTGKDDPTLSLLLVIPEQGYYWDTKNNKVVSLMKILTSTVSGKAMDDGVEGRLKV